MKVGVELVDFKKPSILLYDHGILSAKLGMYGIRNETLSFLLDEETSASIDQ